MAAITRRVASWCARGSSGRSIRSERSTGGPARTCCTGRLKTLPGRRAYLPRISWAPHWAIGTTGARLLLARLSPGESVTLPDDPRQHVFAATGAVSLDGLDLRAGDAVRLTDEPGRTVRAGEETELLVWSFT